MKVFLSSIAFFFLVNCNNKEKGNKIIDEDGQGWTIYPPLSILEKPIPSSDTDSLSNFEKQMLDEVIKNIIK